MVGRLASTTSSLMGDAWSAPVGKLAVRSEGPRKRESIMARKGLEKKSVSESAQRASAILPARTSHSSVPGQYVKEGNFWLDQPSTQWY